MASHPLLPTGRSRLAEIEDDVEAHATRLAQLERTVLTLNARIDQLEKAAAAGWRRGYQPSTLLVNGNGQVVDGDGNVIGVSVG